MCKLELSWLIGSIFVMLSVARPVAWGRLVGMGDSPDQLLQKSEAVFAGRAHDIVDGEKEVLAVQGARLEGRWRIAAFQIDDAIKGDVGHEARVSFFESRGMDMEGPYSSIEPGVRCVVFVRKADGGYRLIDPYTPVIRLNPKAPPPLPANASARDRLRAELEAAASADASEIAILAIDWLTQLGKEALPTFLTLSKSADINVKAAAVAASLRVGDASLLPSVSQLVRAPGFADAGGLYSAVSSIKNPEYGPAVADLLDADDVELRRAASYAIREIGGKPLLPKMAKCLDDPDREVQYNAIMGLARLLDRGKGWATSKALFMKDPEPYLARWREWWQGVGNKGQGQPKQ